MKPDLYTKVVLTVVALMLVLIACHHYADPSSKASAEGPFAGVQFSGVGYSFVLFDSRTGDVWYYDQGPREMLVHHTRVSAPGQPAPAFSEIEK
jgi:hypothetical protein